MIGLTLVIGFVVLSLIAAVAWRERHWNRTLDAEKRRGTDMLAEKQTELDTAVTATFVRVRDEFLERVKLKPVSFPDERFVADAVTPVFSDIEAGLPKGQRDLVQWFRERVGMMNAATQHAQSQVALAAATVNAVNAENTLHRQLLEKSLSLPLDTPEAHRQLFLIRARTALSSPRATPDCPSEEFWRQYVERHAQLAKDGVTT